MPGTPKNRRQRLDLILQRLRPHLARTGWSTLDAVVGPVLSVAVSPILLNRLDSRGFGLWAFAIAVAGFGGLASFGVGIATTKYVAEDRAAGYPEAAVETTRAALTVALCGGLVMLLLGVAFAPLLASTAFVRMGAAGEVSNALLLGIALLALQEIDGVFTGALRGTQRFDLAAQVEIAIRIVWLAAVLSTAWLTRSAIDTLAASVAVGALKVVVKGLAAQSALQGSCMVPSRTKVAILRVLRLGKWLWAQALGGLLFSVVDRLAVGAIFGATDLARYSICMQLAQLVHGIQATALQPLVPWISARAASGQPASTEMLKRIAFFGGWACMAVPLILLAFADTFLSLWIGANFAQENAGICRILLVAYGLLAFNIPIHYLLLGLGSVRFLAAANIAAGVVSLGASLMLSPWGFAHFVLGKVFFAPFIFLNFIVLRKGAQQSDAK